MDENTDEEDAATEEVQDEPEENPEQVKEHCLQMFGGVDYIMEPGVSGQLQRSIL